MIKLKPLLTELTARQKHVKKDYLYRQSTLTSSNKIPSFEDVWKQIRQSDGFKHEMEFGMEDHERGDEAAVEQNIKDAQFERYEEIVYGYQELEGKPCWRMMMLHKSVDPREHQQLGIYWAVQEGSAEAHFGKFEGNYPWKCTYEAIIELKNVDWPGTLYARMDMSGGDEEQEIRFLDNAPLWVRKVKICDTRTDACKDFFISNKRRA